MQSKLFYLAGMPRTGSTLLLNILKQNKNFHIEGTSALSDFMWSSLQTGLTSSFDFLVSSDRFPETIKNIVSSIPSIYYKNVNSKYIIDKSRKWCSLENYNMLKNNYDANPKIIILTRPVEEVVASFVDLYKKNKKSDDEISKLLDLKNNRTIKDSVLSIKDAKNSDGNFLYISYNNLINSTEDQLKKVYSYLEVDYYKHELNKITDFKIETDEAYGLKGLHSINSKIQKRLYNVSLSDAVLKDCYELNKQMQLTK